MTKPPDVKIRLYSKAGGEEAAVRIAPSAGVKFKIDFEDVRTNFKVDFQDRNLVKLILNGKFRIFKKGDASISAGAGVGLGLLEENTSFEGTMEWEIDKNVAVHISSNAGESGSSAMAGLTVKF